MKTNELNTKSKGSGHGQTVVRKLHLVKSVFSKICHTVLTVSLASSVALATISPAHAEDARQRAMLNATGLSNMLQGVLADKLLVVVDKIAKGEIRRIAPEQPVWIMEVIDGTILYYQGQPSFVHQPAGKLVDDDGFRFGQKAIDNAKNSRSGWLRLNLGGKPYQAYCAARYPTVVCSLVP